MSLRLVLYYMIKEQNLGLTGVIDQFFLYGYILDKPLLDICLVSMSSKAKVL